MSIMVCIQYFWGKYCYHMVKWILWWGFLDSINRELHLVIFVHNKIYATSSTTALPFNQLSYLPHRPTVFFCDDFGIFAAHNRFSSHRRQHAEPPSYGKYCQVLIAFISFVRGACSSLWAVVEQLELTELCLRMITAGAQAEYSLVHPHAVNTSKWHSVRRSVSSAVYQLLIVALMLTRLN
jgi:hypothetical protein